MPRPVAYKTGTIQPPNTAKQSNILVGVGPSNWGAGAANATFYNGLDSSYQYVIIKNSAVPAMWGTGDFTTGSLLTTINGLPDRVGQTRFTDATTAISWSLASGNYTILKNEQVYGGPITNGLVLDFNPKVNNYFVNGNFSNGNFVGWGGDAGYSIYDITNDKPYPSSISTKALTTTSVSAIFGRYTSPLIGPGGLLVVGKTYTFSFWAKTLSGNGSIYWQNQDGSGQLTNWQGGSNLTTTWSKITQTFNYNISQPYVFWGGGSAQWLITELQLEDGTTSNPFSYTPATNSGLVVPNNGLLNTSSFSLTNGPYLNADANGNIRLDGIDDKISIANSTDYTSFTISMWVKINSYNAAYTYLFDCPATFFLRANSSAGAGSNSSWLVCNHGGPDSGETGTVYTGSITHIAYTYNGTSYSGSFYINGLKTSSGPRATNIKLSGNMVLGAGENNTNMNVYSTQVYNRPLSDNEIENLYTADLPTYQSSSNIMVNSNLVLYLDASNPNSYPGSGTTWTDISGYGNDFTLVNSPTFNTGNGGYLQFDGVDDYAYLAVNSSISVGLACSLEMVVKNDYAMRMGQGGSYWAYGFEGAGFSHTCGGNGNISPYFMGSEFHHYVFTWNQAQNNHSMYRDGVLVYSFTPTCAFNAGGGGFFVLGGARGNNGFQSYGSPHIAMLRLYNKILTGTEVQQNFNSIKTQFGL